MSKMSDYLKSSLVAGLLLTTACGKVDDLPSDVSGSLSSTIKTDSASSKSDDEIRAAIPKILEGLADIKQGLVDLKSNVVLNPSKPSTGSTPSTGTTKPTTGTTKPTTTSTKPTTGSATPKPAEPKPTTPAAPSGDEELKKVLDLLTSKPFAQASISKTEKHLTEGRVTTGTLNMWTRKPNQVRIDAVTSSSGGAGAKVYYTSGEGDKCKIRPGGALGFVVTDLPKNDDRVDSTNRYLLDQLDLFGIVKRLSSGYKAEVVGKSTVNGIDLHILKVTTTGSNSLDSKITYEYIGYEPSSYKLRLWETYTADSKDPYMRVVITKLEFPATLADSVFKL